MAYLTTTKIAAIAKQFRGSAYNARLLLDTVAAAIAADIAAAVSGSIAANITSGIAADAQLRVQTVTAPAAASATAAANGLGTLVDAQTGVTAGLSSPDVPRALVAVCTAGLTGSLVVHGTNIDDEVVSDTITLNGATPVSGVVAFKTVTSVDIPVWNAEGDTVNIGTLDAFGCADLLTEDTLIKATADGAHEATRPTVVVDAADIEKCTIDPNTAANGSKTFKFYYYA
jgi:hypothetical protein